MSNIQCVVEGPADRVADLRAALAELGFIVVERSPVRLGVTLADIGKAENPALETIALQIAARGGPTTLDVLTQGTVIDAWRWLFTYPGGGQLFTLICQRMAREGVRFADADPREFIGMNQQAITVWYMQRHIPTHHRNALLGCGVIDPIILRQLTDSDIMAIPGLGPKRRPTVTELRDRLQAEAEEAASD